MLIHNYINFKIIVTSIYYLRNHYYNKNVFLLFRLLLIYYSLNIVIQTIEFHNYTVIISFQLTVYIMYIIYILYL